MIPSITPPILVLSADRCGSIIISDLLRQQPAVLSLAGFSILPGQDALAAMPADQVLHRCFEDVQQQPREVLDRMIRFIDSKSADAAWLDAAAATRRPTRSRFATLPPDEQRDLGAACAPGFAPLGCAA